MINVKKLFIRVIFSVSPFHYITIFFKKKDLKLCKISPVFVSDVSGNTQSILLLFSYVHFVILVRCCLMFITENTMTCRKTK